MVDSDTKNRIQTSFDEKNVNEIKSENLKTNKTNLDQNESTIFLLTANNIQMMTTKQELFDSIIGESINESVIENGKFTSMFASMIKPFIFVIGFYFEINQKINSISLFFF